MKNLFKSIAVVALMLAMVTSVSAQKKKGAGPEARAKKEVAASTNNLQLSQEQQTKLYDALVEVYTEWSKPDSDKKALNKKKMVAFKEILTPEQMAKRKASFEATQAKKKAAKAQ